MNKSTNTETGPIGRFPMSELRAKFTENAKQFDALMVEMLTENDQLKRENKMLRKKMKADYDGEHKNVLRLRALLEEAEEYIAALRVYLHQMIDQKRA